MSDGNINEDATWASVQILASAQQARLLFTAWQDEKRVAKIDELIDYIKRWGKEFTELDDDKAPY